MALPVSILGLDVFDYAEPADMTKEYRYRSETVPEMDNGGWKLDGKLVHTPVGTEIVDGNRVLVVSNQPIGLENFPTDYETRFIAKDDGYYSAYVDNAGNREEHLILPADAEIGAVWTTGSFWDNEELESMVSFSFAAGEYDNCVQIRRDSASRTELSSKVGERQVGVDIRCPGIGLVRSEVTNTIGAVGFQTVTVIELISVKVD